MIATSTHTLAVVPAVQLCGLVDQLIQLQVVFAFEHLSHVQHHAVVLLAFHQLLTSPDLKSGRLDRPRPVLNNISSSSSSSSVGYHCQW
jgi:hypothetical protein